MTVEKLFVTPLVFSLSAPASLMKCACICEIYKAVNFPSTPQTLLVLCASSLGRLSRNRYSLQVVGHVADEEWG